MKQKKTIQEIKESIIKFSQEANREKIALYDSIEMFWLNADINRRKADISSQDSSNDNILRIRQLLAAAWSEDFKS